MASSTELNIIIKARDEASRVLSGIGSALGPIAAVGGIAFTAVGVGVGLATKAGLDFNNAMEQAQARINAFTKDSGATAEILETIRQRAAATPFAFEEMTNAAASLLPMVKQTGAELEELIGLAEILAASNPAQGLEGAAFAIKEALGGDFVSAIERFNLSRVTINRLKDEGVPNLEIISQAMKEMGLDADLVSQLANTASGRWSTFKDTIVGLAGIVTQPIFDTFSAGLGNLNTWLAANQPMLEAWANTAAEKIQTVIGIFTNLAEGNTTQALQDFQRELLKVGFSPEQTESISASINTIVEDAGRISAAFGEIFSGANVDSASAFVTVLDSVAWAMERIATAAETAKQLVEIFQHLGGFGGVNALIANAAQGIAIQPSASSVALTTQIQEARQQGSAFSPEASAQFSQFMQSMTNFFTQRPVGAYGQAQEQAPITITMDGQKVAELVSQRQGRQANNQAAMGAMGY